MATGSQRLMSILRKCLTLLPLVVLILFVTNYAVAVPYLDQWDFVPCLQRMYEGNLTFHDLWQQHHEHRLVFPKLIMLGLAKLTRWDVRFELTLNIVLAIGIMAVVVWQIQSTSRKLSLNLEWAIPISSLAVFSITQWQNWLWGWQLQMLLSLLVVVTGIALLSGGAFSWRRLACAALLGVIATYSFANGAIFWAIGLMLIALTANPKQKRSALATWLGVACVTMTCYFRGYHHPTHHPPLRLIFELPIEDYALYVINYLGGSFAQLSRQPHWIIRCLVLTFGFGGPCVVATLSWRIARQGRKEFLAILPFIAMSVYSVGTAFLAGVGRVGMGTDQALHSRYCTMVMPLWISLIALLFIWSKLPATGAFGKSRKPIATTALGATIVSLILTSALAIRWAEVWSQNLTTGLKSLTTMSHPTAAEDLQRVTALHPQPEVVIQGSLILKQYKLSVFRDSAHQAHRITGD